MTAIEGKSRSVFYNPVILNRRIPLIAYDEAEIQRSLVADGFSSEEESSNRFRALAMKSATSGLESVIFSVSATDKGLGCGLKFLTLKFLYIRLKCCQRLRRLQSAQPIQRNTVIMLPSCLEGRDLVTKKSASSR
jgi:hypothetical protein